MSVWDKKRRSSGDETLGSKDALELLNALVEKSLVFLDGAEGGAP